MSQNMKTISFKKILYFESFESLDQQSTTSHNTYDFPILDDNIDLEHLIAVKVHQSYPEFKISEDNILIIDTAYTPNDDNKVIVKQDQKYVILPYSSIESRPYLGTIIQLIQEFD